MKIEVFADANSVACEAAVGIDKDSKMKVA
jgi:hypothetical protein